MIQPGGFVDLRPNSGNRATEESIWPSFTDIMTVIVMIFLMALVVILIRNVDLVRQLRQTIELEQESATQSDTLELHIATLSDEIASLQLRLGENDALLVRAESTADESQQKISQLLVSVAALQQIRDELLTENIGLASSRDSLQGQLLSIEERQKLLEDVERGLKNDIAALALERDTLLEDKSALTEQNVLLSEQYREETSVLLELNLTLEQQVADLVALKSVMEQRVQTLTETKLSLEGDQAALSEANAGLSRKLSALTQFQIELERQVDDLSLTVSRLEGENARLFEENRSTTDWLGTLLELRQSLEADKQALTKNLAESEQAQNALKKDQVALEYEVSELIQVRLTLEQEKAGLIDEATALEKERREQQDSQRTTITEMELAQSFLEKQNIELEQKLKGSEKLHQLTKKELDYLVSKHTEEITAFKKERALFVENLQAFALLKSQYGELEIAYNRLVRPARNEVGRFRVEVRFWKENDDFHYSITERGFPPYNEPGPGAEKEVSKDDLHKRLRKLKEDHPGKLFTHVIFPGGKDISHEEGWLFERSITTQYDYYSQP